MERAPGFVYIQPELRILWSQKLFAFYFLHFSSSLRVYPFILCLPYLYFCYLEYRLLSVVSQAFAPTEGKSESCLCPSLSCQCTSIITYSFHYCRYSIYYERFVFVVAVRLFSKVYRTHMCQGVWRRKKIKDRILFCLFIRRSNLLLHLIN